MGWYCCYSCWGNLDVPTFAGGGDSDHLIYTLQHASGWKYGDNFFFIDVLDARGSGFQDFDLYGEWYSNFSLGKVTGKKSVPELFRTSVLFWASTGLATPM